MFNGTTYTHINVYTKRYNSQTLFVEILISYICLFSYVFVVRTAKLAKGDTVLCKFSVKSIRFYK